MKPGRRRFLKTTATAALLVEIPSIALAADAPAAPAPSPLRWVRIASDGGVTVLSNTSEIGQGTGTAIAQVLADELDIDWKRVRLDMAPVEKDYFNAAWGEYATYGSGGIAGQYEALRKAGAQARARLVAAAAARWSVARGECDTSLGSVVHAKSGRRLAYASLVSPAAAMPEIAGVEPMPQSRWRYVGREVKRLDIPSKVNGTARFGIDAMPKQVLVATVRQSPRFGGKLASVDPAPALAIAGVRRVVKLEEAVAVIAADYWTAKRGLDALSPIWDESGASTATSPAYEDSLVQAVRQGGTVRAKRGSTVEATTAEHAAAMAKAATTAESIYTVPFLAHATMEPMNATALVTALSVELWLPTQDQSTARSLVAKLCGIPESAVTLHTMLAGGGFGRRIEPDFTMLAARIAKEIPGTPVKTVWSREEDMRHGYYRPAAAVKLTAGVDAAGKLVALRFDSACASLLKYSRFGAFAQYMKPVDPAAIGEMPGYYRAPMLAAATTVDAGVPVAFWRSVAASQNTFAYESFVDELAHRVGVDPVVYRRSLLAEDSRERRALDAAVDRAGVLADGRHRGVALVTANGTCVALVADVSIAGGSRVKVHRVAAAVDCGLAVNPNSVRAQVEGGIAFGLTAAFLGEITLDNGAVRQSNFHDYPLVTMAQMPRVDVVLVDAGGKPSGVGEEAVGPLAPAIANAIFAATGKRVRALPFSRSGLTLA